MKKKTALFGIISLIIIALVVTLGIQYFKVDNRNKRKLRSTLGISHSYDISNVKYKKLRFADASYSYVVISSFEIDSIDFKKFVDELSLKQPNDVSFENNPNLYIYNNDEDIAFHAISNYWLMKSQYGFYDVESLFDYEWWRPDTIIYTNNYSTFFDSKEKVSSNKLKQSNCRITIQRKSNKVFLILEHIKSTIFYKLLDLHPEVYDKSQ